MTALFWTWFSITLFITIVGFILMAIHLSQVNGRYTPLARNVKWSKRFMWASLLAPLWPAVILVGPALLIKWVAGQYRQVMKMEVAK